MTLPSWSRNVGILASRRTERDRRILPGPLASADAGSKVPNGTRRYAMPEGYDFMTGLLVAVIVVVMIGGAFGRSHP